MPWKVPDYKQLDQNMFHAVLNHDLGIDPDSLAPNRTAKSAEQTVELLKEMQAGNKRESIKTTAILIISILALIVAAIGVFR